MFKSPFRAFRAAMVDGTGVYRREFQHVGESRNFSLHSFSFIRIRSEDLFASGINLRTGPPAGSKQTEMARTVFFTLTVFLRILARKPTKRNCFFLTTSYRPRNDLTALSDVMGMHGSLKLSLVFNLDISQLSLEIDLFRYLTITLPICLPYMM